MYGFGLPLWYLQTLLLVATMTWLTVTEYLCHIWSRICSLCRNHELVLSSFMNYHRVWSQSNSTESLVEQELLTLPEGLGSQPVFCGVHYAQSIDFWVVFCRSVWSFCPFYFGNCIGCLRFTASAFGIYLKHYASLNIIMLNCVS